MVCRRRGKSQLVEKGAIGGVAEQLATPDHDDGQVGNRNVEPAEERFCLGVSLEVEPP
jgi:hypothetical protein